MKIRGEILYLLYQNYDYDNLYLVVYLIVYLVVYLVVYLKNIY